MAPNGGVQVPDGYVRVSRSELAAVSFRQLASAIDLSIAVPEGFEGILPNDVLTGYTEWAGTWQRVELSIGWDWGVVGNAVVILNPAQIRTNILLVTEGGLAEAPLLARAHLLERIEELPWRELLTNEVIASFKP
jgi:hypothetical protein